MYSYDAVIISYIIPAIHSWFCRSARDKVVFYVDFCSFKIKSSERDNFTLHAKVCNLILLFFSQRYVI